jgi:hypothetical protein
MERWETTARFLRDHGIDPLEALGAPPATPAETELTGSTPSRDRV